MKVHLIKQTTIEAFVRHSARSRPSFALWLAKVKYADWTIPEDMQYTFASADLLGGGSNRVVFDIAGNTYRMICRYAFGEKQVHLFICWIGTHAQYDKLCKEEKQYSINLY